MPKILGVNIDSGSLHASLIESTFRSVKHIKSERLGLPQNRDERNSAIAAALTKWQKEYAPSGVVFGLPLQNFSWRTVEMLSMKRADMKRALFFELEKYLPLPMDEYIYDFLVTDSATTTPGMIKLMVFSVKKEVLNGLLKTAIDAGMEILSVRCSTIDILCGVMDIADERKLRGIFVNSTDDAYEIAGLHDSMPLFLKRLPKSADLTDEIEALAMTYPGKLYVSGPVEQAVTGKFNSKKFQVLAPDLLASSFVNNSCLNLNFLPEKFIKQKKDYYSYSIGVLAAAAVFVFVLTGAMAWYKDRHALKEIEAEISKIRDRASEVIEVRKKFDVLKSDRSVLTGFQNNSNVSVRALSELSRILPKDAWLINISIDDKGRVEMEGFAVRTAELVVALEKSKAFKNIFFSAPITARNGEERFALKMEVGEF